MSQVADQSDRVHLDMPATASAGALVEYLLVNDSDYGAVTGLAFGLDRKTPGGWESVELNMVVAAIGLIVEPGHSRQLHAKIPDGTPAGVYRLRQSFRLGPRQGLGWAWSHGGPPEFEVAATFRVTTQ
jgi:hypothetical protein